MIIVKRIISYIYFLLKFKKKGLCLVCFQPFSMFGLNNYYRPNKKFCSPSCNGKYWSKKKGTYYRKLYGAYHRDKYGLYYSSHKYLNSPFYKERKERLNNDNTRRKLMGSSNRPGF